MIPIICLILLVISVLTGEFLERKYHTAKFLMLFGFVIPLILVGVVYFYA